MKQILLVGLLLTVTDLAAQEVLTLALGDQVRIKARSVRGARITARTPWIRGHIVALAADTLRMKSGSGDTLAVPLASVTRLEVRAKSTGRLGVRAKYTRHWEDVRLPLSPALLRKFAAQERLSVAQESLSAGGDRVRVRASSSLDQTRSSARGGGEWIDGNIVSLTADTLKLRVAIATPSVEKVHGVFCTTWLESIVAIPLVAITEFEKSRGRVSRGKGALHGAGIAFLAGGIIGALSPNDPDSYIQFDRGESFVLGGTSLALLGAAIGAMQPHETWDKVPLPLQVGVSPSGSPRVALHFEFGR